MRVSTTGAACVVYTQRLQNVLHNQHVCSCEVNSIPVSQALCSALSVVAVMVACEMEPLLAV